MAFLPDKFRVCTSEEPLRVFFTKEGAMRYAADLFCSFGPFNPYTRGLLPIRIDGHDGLTGEWITICEMNRPNPQEDPEAERRREACIGENLPANFMDRI